MGGSVPERVWWILVGSARDRLLGAFGLWVPDRNWAVKPGVQVPVYDDLPGSALEHRFVFAIELQV